MSRALIAVLVVTNLATGYQAWVYHQRHQAAISDQTTDREREVGGAACVKWLTGKLDDKRITLAFGRSWKKHGQLVFEVLPATDDDWKIANELSPDGKVEPMLCTVDKQSGMMYLIPDGERERWMFYN